MSTVTLSKPHCAITSAENPDGIASQAFTTALPEAHTFLTLFATLHSFPVVEPCRHCEEHLRRSNPVFAWQPWIASRRLSSGAHSRDPVARNDGLHLCRCPLDAHL